MPAIVLSHNSYCEYDTTEAKRREVEDAARKVRKAAKRAAKHAEEVAATADAASTAKPAPAEIPTGAPAVSKEAAKPTKVPDTPVCFLFPGQGSQALGMLNVRVTPHVLLLFSMQCGQISLQQRHSRVRCEDQSVHVAMPATHRFLKVGRTTHSICLPHGLTGPMMCTRMTLPRTLSLAKRSVKVVSPAHSQATKDIPAVKAMLREAQQALGYDLLQLCTDGPKEKLDDTAYAQVCCTSCVRGHPRLIIERA
jgi:hypothetical protein